MTHKPEAVRKARMLADGKRITSYRDLRDLLSYIDTLTAERDELQDKHNRLVQAIREARRYTPEIFGQGAAGEWDKDEDWFPVMLPDDAGLYAEIEPRLKEIGDE